MAKFIAAAAIIAIGLICAATFGRFDIEVHIGGPIKQVVVYRVDRLTGTVESCFPVYASFDDPSARRDQPEWCKADLLPGK